MYQETEHNSYLAIKLYTETKSSGLTPQPQPMLCSTSVLNSTFPSLHLPRKLHAYASPEA